MVARSASEPGEANEREPIAALVHPVYLDVPMMVSFLAALRDGVEFENTVTRRDQRASSRGSEGSGKVRLPPLASLFGLEASGKMLKNDADEVSEETQVVRQHTAASLFNALHNALRDDERLKLVDDAADLNDVAPGDVVEMTGEFIGNPLEPILEFFRQAAPYVEMLREPEELPGVDLVTLRLEIAGMESRAEDLRARATHAARSGNPALKGRAEELREEASEAERQVKLGYELLRGTAGREEQERAFKILKQMSDDLAESPVHDTVIQRRDLRAVLTMSAEFFTDVTREHLRAGVYRVVGKVTRVLTEGDELNLLRRTVLGVTQPELGRDILQSAVEEGDLKIDTYDPIITAPALQILPLAVFI